MKKSFHSEVIPLSQVPRTRKLTEDNWSVVLVVDDEPLVAETLALILSRAGFQSRAVQSGSDALDLAQIIRPSLLLTDVHMPGMNGVELALAFTTSFPDCKVVLFSGRATAEDLAPALAAGVEFPMLSKPIHPTLIIDYISNSLARGSSESVLIRERSLHPATIQST